MASSERSVVCSHLVKIYESASGRVQALRGVDLELEPGSVTAVVGPSGSGKTSLLRIIAGLDPPTAGNVLVHGEDLYASRGSARAHRRGALIGHVHAQPSANLLGHLDVAQQLERLDRGEGVPVADALEMVGLAGMERRRPLELSGGEQQRLALARTAVSGHRVVIADEPTSQLDGASAERVLTVIRRLASTGSTVVVATHDVRVFGSVDAVVALRDGAVATVSIAGTALGVIDGAGRIQLPPEIRERFAGSRVRLTWDAEARHLTVEEP